MLGLESGFGDSSFAFRGALQEQIGFGKYVYHRLIALFAPATVAKSPNIPQAVPS